MSCAASRGKRRNAGPTTIRRTLLSTILSCNLTSQPFTASHGRPDTMCRRDRSSCWAMMTRSRCERLRICLQTWNVLTCCTQPGHHTQKARAVKPERRAISWYDGSGLQAKQTLDSAWHGESKAAETAADAVQDEWGVCKARSAVAAAQIRCRLAHGQSGSRRSFFRCGNSRRNTSQACTNNIGE